MKSNITEVPTGNDDFQYIRDLRENRSKRHKHRAFFVEGVRSINQALAHQWTINAFIYSREQRLSDWAEGVLAASQAKTHFELPLRLLYKLSEKQEPSELLALMAMPEDDLGRIPLKADMLIVILDRPSNPGNLGAILRACDAFGVDGVVMTGHAVDLYDPETIRATTGSFFALPVVRLPSHQELSPWFERIRQTVGPFQIVGTSAKAEKPIHAHDLTQPTLLVIGNETHGLNPSYRALCHTMLTIPMRGSATSLNVACATSVMLYEIDRQRRHMSIESDRQANPITEGKHP